MMFCIGLGISICRYLLTKVNKDISYIPYWRVLKKKAEIRAALYHSLSLTLCVRMGKTKKNLDKALLPRLSLDLTA